MTVIPTIHLNGTSKQELLQGHLDALSALRIASYALRQAAPHGRDYYPQGNDAYTEAATSHTARLKALDGIIKEIEAIAEGIVDQSRHGGWRA